MNKENLELLRELKKNTYVTQREIAEACGFSLGKTNRLLNLLMKNDFIMAGNNQYNLSSKAHEELEKYRVDNAIIMAAGFGSRFVPLSYETPKGLLEVFGERMIERQIKQLHEVDIMDITIVVGYLKEKFEYLIDKYGVKLVYNPEYSTKNNLSTIYHVRHLLKNTYILSSDNYMTKNLYNTYEFESWYCAVKSKGETDEWCLITDRKSRIEKVEVGGYDQWHMYGPVFFSKDFSDKFVPIIERAYNQPGTDDFYWEDVLKDNIDDLVMYINPQPENTVYEFENLEELREFDHTYRERSNNRIMSIISSSFHIKENEIRDIQPLKLGMTNKSFLFRVNGKKYICRIPGEGTEQLINRQDEYNNYQAVIPLKITDNIVFIDPKTGIKISEYEEGARATDINSDSELEQCMKMIRELHNSGITVPHKFDIEKNILFYENLCRPLNAIKYEDYPLVRMRMSELLSILKEMDIPRAFSHIDPVQDNFLVLPDGEMKLIDWEYAGMCDPVIDISMFAIYSYFDNDQLEKIMKYYFEGHPSYEERLRVYIYVALAGFLWALWAEYKQALGVSFGEYTIKMYRYAKDYYKKSMELVAGGKAK